MKCFYEAVFLLLISILDVGRSSIVPKKLVRNGKFMAFTAHDMFSDLLDDVQDPLPIAGTVNLQEKNYRMNNTIKPTISRLNKTNDTKMSKFPIKSEEKIALYNQNTGKFELITTTSGHFLFPMKPVTEKGVFVYGGQHYRYKKPIETPPGGNRTEEIKIFWSSVGDAVENIPFLPIQINVPDMFNAMTNFLVNYIPFINRLTNPNHPRLPYQVSKKNQSENPADYYETYDIHNINDNSLNKREFEDGIILEEKSTKLRKKTKRKSNKKKNSKVSPKRIFQRPNLRKTTSSPVEEIKLWHQFGSDQKETFRMKNMPITRKRVRVADREIFNFKNSDISNSPIMILNVPQRPITHYKISHQEIREKESKHDKTQPQSVMVKPQQKAIVPEAVTRASPKQRRRTKSEVKSKRSSKRSGRAEFDVTEQSTAN